MKGDEVKVREEKTKKRQVNVCLFARTYLSISGLRPLQLAQGH